ncbi:MAG: hypothetical protein LBP52_10335 [Burkholderiaceae bacterium]|jgi:hypothetical protein|nr:hypothetical protein [Burkholderiaceae bacterium]
MKGGSPPLLPIACVVACALLPLAACDGTGFAFCGESNLPNISVSGGAGDCQRPAADSVGAPPPAEGAAATDAASTAAR